MSKETKDRHILDELELFHILDETEKKQIINLMNPASFKMGEIIFESGHPSKSLYVILDGFVRLIDDREGGNGKNLGRLDKGKHFGESSLTKIENSNEVTALASEDVQLLELKREDFLTWLDSKPKIQKYLTEFLEHNAMRGFLQHSTVLAPLDYQSLRSLLDKMDVQFYEKGENIVTDGEQGDAFYILRSGSANVLKEIDGSTVQLNRLETGAFFGELALLTGEPRKATVQADDESSAFRLMKDDFDALIVDYPKIKESIMQIASNYREFDDDIPFDIDLSEDRAVLDPEVEIEWAAEPKKAGEGKSKQQKTSKKQKKRLRYPFLLQQSEMDCGPTCLAMISKYYGNPISVNTMRNMVSISTEGASLQQLSDAADVIGFKSRGVKTDFAGLKEIDLPAIIHWKGYHYVVVYKITDKYVLIGDPSYGLDKIPHTEFNKNWTGIVLAVEPTDELATISEHTNSFGKYGKYLKPYKKLLFDLLVVSIIIEIIALSFPLITQFIVDNVIVSSNVSLLNILLFAMLAFSVFQLIFLTARQFVSSTIALKIDTAMVGDFYKHVLSLPLSFFLQRKVGDIISRVNENEKIRQLLTVGAINLVLDIVRLAAYGGLMLYFNVQLSLIAFSILPFFALLILLVSPHMRRNSRKEFQAGAEAQSTMVQSIKTISTIKAMAVEKNVRWIIEDSLHRLLKHRAKGTVLTVLSHSSSHFLQVIGQAILLYFGALFVLDGKMSVGEFIAMTVLFATVLQSVGHIIEAWDQIMDVKISMERLNDVFDAVPEQADPNRYIRMPRIHGDIKFENVTFRYEENGRNILQNINLDIPRGQKVAIIGRSGSGKSTFANLLLKLYSPSSGAVAIDGYDIRQVHSTTLRKQIGVVEQENKVFSKSIKENISYGFPDTPMEKIIEAAKLAGAHEFILRLPLGYDTQIGEGGLNLSGGQLQRITIARALVGDPRILIFDEATSALDTESERIIQENMGQILKDRTTLMIAHRLSTVKQADKIIVLDQGVIVEQGTHDELYEQKGLYYYLLCQQD